MGAHTKGPWDYVPANEHHGPYVTTDYGTTVADLYVLSEPVAWSSEARKPIPFMGEMAEANARLIASAPDLLEALKGLVALHDSPTRPGDSYAAARAAIRKATREAS